jgi:hypothetical protein
LEGVWKHSLPERADSCRLTGSALVLNKTNFTALSMMFGEDTNDWIGGGLNAAQSHTPRGGTAKGMPNAYRF